MLVGLHCHTQKNITTLMMEQATRNLKKFFFVGVTERFREGIFAFHKIMNTGSEPSHAELEIRRSGAYSKKDQEICYQWMKDNNFEDPYDNEIYELASTLFNQTMQDIAVGNMTRWNTRRFRRRLRLR